MINSLLKKITAGILIIVMTFSFAGFVLPQEAHAQWLTFDAANTAQSTITASNTTGTLWGTMSLQIKAFVLDTLATTLAKQLIRQITASVVNWINSGFSGSPSFIQNPGGFFLDVADQVTGDFLAQTGGPLASLCSPFSIDIRLALAFKYHPNTNTKYACTLGAIIKNTQNASVSVNGQSLGTIGGFMNGDFNQGGWPAFITMTTQPQNNIYGAYLEADSELSIRVANAQAAKKDEISNGKGFLSWRDPKCVDAVKASNAKLTATYNSVQQNSTGEGGGQGDISAPTLKSTADCPIQTPGSLIFSSIDQSTKTGVVELQLVDSINQIVSALAAQLVTTILQKGLGAVSGTGPSDSTSYISQVQAEANASGQLTSTKSDLLTSIGKYLSDALTYKTNRDQALSLAYNAQNAYQDVSTCYSQKISNSEPSLTPLQSSEAQSKIDIVTSIMHDTVSPLVAQLTTADQDAQDKYNALTDIQSQVNAAQTATDLSTASNKFASLLQSQSLITPFNVNASQDALDTAKSQTTPMIQQANGMLNACQSFPNWSTYANP